MCNSDLIIVHEKCPEIFKKLSVVSDIQRICFLWYLKYNDWINLKERNSKMTKAGVFWAF
jgi:hypothetical protein